MSFVRPEHVQKLVEGLVATLWSKAIQTHLVVPFRRLSYQEAMTRFGSDKPDLRYDIQVCRAFSFCLPYLQWLIGLLTSL